MHVTVAIPTRNRVAKLAHTIRSIPKTDWIDIVIGVDNDRTTARDLPADVRERVRVVEFLRASKEPFGSVYVRNRLMQYAKDAVLYGCDDVEFLPNCIENAVAMHAQAFPDGDGLVGLQQNTAGFNEWGMGIIGRPFIEQFKAGHVFFPGYSHFAAHELGTLAKRRGRFLYCAQAKTLHFHPTDSKNAEYLDQTHLDARKLSRMDIAIKQRRQAKGVIWGEEPHTDRQSYEPWLREWIKQIWPSRVLEWGSGLSTEAIHETVLNASITGIEYVPAYYQRARERYGKIAQIHHAHIPPHGETEYAALPLISGWDPFDLIFVNGACRVECLLVATKILNPGGVVILHNADRISYSTGIELYTEIDAAPDKTTRVLQLEAGDIHRADEPVLKPLV